MFRKFLILIISFIFIPISVFAQIEEFDIVLNLNPEQPKVNEKIEARISSFVINTKEAYYVWKIDEETRLTGVGRDSFTFVLDQLNQKTQLSVEISTKEGKNIRKVIQLGGAEVDLLWEATNSFVPPFYKGKALFAREGDIKVTAMFSSYRNNSNINSSNFSYAWTRDNKNQIKDSGFGKNYFSYKNSFIYPSNNIELFATDINKEFEVKSTINIPSTEPKIVFYSLDEKGINTNKSLKNKDLIPKEGKNIVAMPYFFSPKNINSNELEINWFINNELIKKTESKNILPVIPEEGQEGSANIKVIINNINTLFQEVQKNINVSF